MIDFQLLLIQICFTDDKTEKNTSQKKKEPNSLTKRTWILQFCFCFLLSIWNNSNEGQRDFKSSLHLIFNNWKSHLC